MALLPPPEALAEIAAVIGPIRAEWSQLRWVDPALWHVTVAFLGEVPDEVLPELRVRLARAAGRHSAQTVAFGGAGAFPSASRGRVLWVGLDAGVALTRLAGSVAAGARRAGAVETDRKRFRPHLTLARSRTPSREGDDLRPLVGALGAFGGRRWEVSSVHLVRSHTGATVRYEQVEAYPLAVRD